MENQSNAPSQTHRTLMQRGERLDLSNRQNKRESIVYIPENIKDELYKSPNSRDNTNVSRDPEAKSECKSEHVEEKSVDHVWESCCLKMNSKCIIYSGQILVSVLVLGLCTYMLILSDGDCNRSSSYINLIAFLLGKLLSDVATSA